MGIDRRFSPAFALLMVAGAVLILATGMCPWIAQGLMILGVPAGWLASPLLVPNDQREYLLSPSIIYNIGTGLVLAGFVGCSAIAKKKFQNSNLGICVVTALFVFTVLTLVSPLLSDLMDPHTR